MTMDYFIWLKWQIGIENARKRLLQTCNLTKNYNKKGTSFNGNLLNKIQGYIKALI